MASRILLERLIMKNSQMTTIQDAEREYITMPLVLAAEDTEICHDCITKNKSINVD